MRCLFFLLAATALAHPSGTVRFEHPSDSTKWGNAFLAPSGALELTASKCVDTSNFCGKYKDTTGCSSNAAVVSKVVFRSAGSSAEARMQLHADGVLAFVVPAGGCVDPAGGAKNSYAGATGLVLVNGGTEGSIEFSTSTKKVIFFTSAIDSALNPVCKCTNGAAATGSCNKHDEHHCVSCSGAFFLDGTTCSAHVVNCDAQGKVVQTAASNTADAVCGANKQCTCSNGTGATGTACPSDGAAKCTACGRGYGFVSASSSCEQCLAADKKYSMGDDNSACADHVTCAAGFGSNFGSLSDSETQ